MGKKSSLSPKIQGLFRDIYDWIDTLRADMPWETSIIDEASGLEISRGYVKQLRRLMTELEKTLEETKGEK